MLRNVRTRVCVFVCVFVFPAVRWLDPHDAETYRIQDQFAIGNDVIVAPVVTRGATTRDVYLTEGQWVDAQAGTLSSPHVSSRFFTCLFTCLHVSLHFTHADVFSLLRLKARQNLKSTRVFFFKRLLIRNWRVNGCNVRPTDCVPGTL